MSTCLSNAINNSFIVFIFWEFSVLCFLYFFLPLVSVASGRFFSLSVHGSVWGKDVPHIVLVLRVGKGQHFVGCPCEPRTL